MTGSQRGRKPASRLKGSPCRSRIREDCRRRRGKRKRRKSRNQLGGVGDGAHGGAVAQRNAQSADAPPDKRQKRKCAFGTYFARARGTHHPPKRPRSAYLWVSGG